MKQEARLQKLEAALRPRSIGLSTIIAASYGDPVAIQRLKDNPEGAAEWDRLLGPKAPE